MKKQNILILVIVIVAVAIGGWYVFSMNSQNQSYGNVVATVNGEDISGEEFGAQFSQVEQTYMEQDAEFDKEQLEEYILDQMIANVLLRQEAENMGLTVPDAEVQEELDVIIQSGGGQDVFEEAIVEAGISEEMLRKDIKSQILINGYINSQISEGSVSVTDEEIRALYDSYSQTATEGEMPSFEEAEEEIRMELVQQKQNSMLEELVNTLREEAEIEVQL